MSNQIPHRNAESFRTSKITPSQVAFIVDMYLKDNNFSNTRSAFHVETSSLFANFPISKVPKNLLSLQQMLDEYIHLKQKSTLVDQEREVVMQERNAVRMVMQGMQNVIDTYNALPNHPLLPNVTLMNAGSAMLPPQPTLCNETPPGVPTITTTVAAMQNNSLPKLINTNGKDGIVSTPTICRAFNKRKDTQALGVPTPAKKPRGRPPGQNTLQQSSNAMNNQVVCLPNSSIQSSTGNFAPSISQVQGFSATKCLINQPSFPVSTNSPVQKTPIRTYSSHGDRCVSFADTPLTARCNEEPMPSHYSVSPTKRVMVSPAKQMTYIEESRCISTTKSDADKEKLDFDASNGFKRLDKLPNEVATIESGKEVDISSYLSDIDFSAFDNDILISHKDIDFSDHPSPAHSKDDASGYL